MSDLRNFRVLIPVDLGHSSEAALRYAQMLVSRIGAKLTVMYVNDALTLQSYDQIYAGYRDLPPEQEEMMEDAVREYATPILGATPFDVLVVADDTAPAIVTAADRNDVNLIVMGTHGRHGWQRFIDGSLAEAVLHRSDRPVITVPQDHPFEVSRILCPVNFTEAARIGARAACSMARALESKLHLLHVIEEPQVRPGYENEVREAIGEWVAPFVGTSCEFEQIVSHAASAADHILEHARHLQADMLVVGTRHGGRAHARTTVGTTVEKLVRTAHLPVMSLVHPFGIRVSAAA